MKYSSFVKSQWRWTRRFFIFFPFLIALITGINLWHDFQSGADFDPMHLLYAAGMIAFAGIIFTFNRLIFKFFFAWSAHEEERK